MRAPAFAAALLPVLAWAQAPPDPRDWPGLLGARRDGHSRETGLALEWDEAGPTLLWHANAGLGFSAPAIAGGRLFFFDREENLARLRALDAATGSELWRSSYPTDYEDYYGYSPGPRASPVVDEDRVYVFGVEGRLRCQDVATGAVRWEIDTAERFGVVQNFFGVGSTPIVAGELLIVPIGGSAPGSPKIHSGRVRGDGTGLVAFDKRTGAVRWTGSDELASYSSPVLATVHGRRWGFAFMRGGLLGFAPDTGAIAFHFPWRAEKLESVNAANPVVTGDRILISESYGPGSALLRADADGTAELLWKDPPARRRQSLRLHWMTPIVHRDTVYGSSGTGSGDAELRAVSLDTGEVRWREPGLGRATLILADSRLIALTEFGRLLVIRPDPERFDLVADATPERPGARGQPLLAHPAWTPPALAQRRLYVRGKDRLACFDLTGTGGAAGRRGSPAQKR